MASGRYRSFLVDEISNRLTVILWSFAGVLCCSPPCSGSFLKDLGEGTIPEVGAGLLVGVLLVIVTDRLIAGYEFAPREMAVADFKKLILIVGVLTVHGFPEGVALGVIFADLGVEGDVVLGGLAVPALAICITIAISAQNIPERLAVAIPLKTFGVPNWQIGDWAVFSSLPSHSMPVSHMYSSRGHVNFFPPASGSPLAR